MTFGKKALLGTVAALALVGQAHAVEIANAVVGSGAGSTLTSGGTYVLASELNLAGTAAPTGTIAFDVRPTTGVLPSGNIVLTVNLAGATFQTAVGGGAVIATGTGTTTCSATSVLSSGGTTATGTVVFILSGLNGCGDDAGEGVRVSLPVRVSGPVSVTAGLTTEASVPVDGGSVTRSGLVTFASAFDPAVTKDTGTSRLTILSGFTSFGTSDGVLGTVQVKPSTGTVYSNLTSTAATAPTNVTSVTVKVDGTFTGFGTGTGQATLSIGTGTAVIAAGSASLTVTGTTAQAFASGAQTITINPGTTVLSASDYTGTITASYATASGFVATTEQASAALDAVVREGTTIVFPWTASSSAVAASGSNNVIRIGNRSGAEITGLYARVVNASGTGYNTAQVPLGLTIPANGEAIIDSALLTGKLGEFGRGDVEIVVEASPSDLTTRRLVVRPDGVFDWRAGAD